MINGVEILSKEKIFFNQSKRFKIGVPVRAESLNLALGTSQYIAGKEGHVASLPEIIDARIYADKDGHIWSPSLISCATEENKGKTKQGNSVCVVAHSKGILMNDVNRIQKAYIQGLINNTTAKLTQNEFNNLLEGRLPDKSELPIFSYDDFVKQSDLPLAFAVVLDLDKVIKAHKFSSQPINEFKENELYIARVGSEERTHKHIDKLAERGIKRGFNDAYCAYFHREHLDVDIPQGNLIWISESTLNSNVYLNTTFTYFIAVKTKNIGSTLE